MTEPLVAEVTSPVSLIPEGLRPTPFNASKDAYFKDGTTKIDYVVVYEENISSDSSPLRKTKKIIALFHKLTPASAKIARDQFFASITKEGLVVEEEVIDTERKITHFYKISAPWEAMLYHAERLFFRQPMEVQASLIDNWSDSIFTRVLHVPNPFILSLPWNIPNFSTCPFRRSKTDRFLFSDSEKHFFSNRQRIRAVFEIVRLAPYGDINKGEIGILRMVHDGIFTDAFALHDSTHKVYKSEVGSESLTLRQILDYYWAGWNSWYKYQPLGHIREYYGEIVAFYFAWLGFYTSWLAPFALAGVLTFIVEIIVHFSADPVAGDACSSDNQYNMCPLCNDCSYWKLSDACFFRRLGATVDSVTMVIFSIFVSVWAVMFLEFWKRKSATLAFQWGRFDFSKDESPPRPEYAARAPKLILNPVTGRWEPYIPKATTTARLIATSVLIISMMTLAIVAILAVLVYRGLVGKQLTQMDLPESLGSLAAIVAASFLQLIVMITLGEIYTRIAVKLTDWEMLRTQADYDNSLTIKIFIFQFVNFYSPLFYIAFFKQALSVTPGRDDSIFGVALPVEKCQAGMCYVELCIQLLIILIGKQVLSNIMEIAMPIIKNWIRKKRVMAKSRSAIKLSLLEDDYYSLAHPGFSEEYMEMVLQFGFVTIFVSAFPLAPLFAFINNITEIRVDAQKLTRRFRRPVPKPARDIEIWATLLDSLVKVAVITNALLITFTSDFLLRIVYQVDLGQGLKDYLNFTLSKMPLGSPGLTEECRYFSLNDAFNKDCCFQWRLQAVKFIFILLYENAVFGLQMAIKIFVPNVPYKLQVLLKREHYLAKTALAGSVNRPEANVGSVKRRQAT